MSDFGDVERLKKMNQMIPELKKYGFATFNDEASQVSQEIMKEEIPVAPPESPAMERHFEMFKQQVNQRCATMEANLKNVMSKMNEMIKTINELEKKPKPIVPSNDVPRSPEPKKSDKKGGIAQKDQNLEPGDVDISGVFYCGTK